MLFYSIIGVLQLLSFPSSQMAPKVAHGNRTDIKYHPYSAFVKIAQVDSGEAIICGSSILNQKIILTAGHCFDHASLRTRGTANFGHTDRRKGFIIHIDSVKVHPQYNKRKIINDIALAGLVRELRFSDVIKRIALSRHRPPKNVVALLAGWGLISEEPVRATNVLHETNQKVWAYKDCVNLLKNIPDGTFCGGRHAESGYAAIGDSGSPLVVDNYLQIGLVSFKKVHLSVSVIIYTDIAYFYNWITENAGSVFCG